MPASRAPKRVKATPTEASDALYTRCLLDCIDLNLTDIQIYVGRRRSQAPNRRPETSEEDSGQFRLFSHFFVACFTPTS
ncbi:unnamed protein product [Dibothriocephalus latus]|uniref:Uncharacterized protein n=1 Tax=Dibothriocephalus latus TaxID=60516 RepID=A0A3P7LDK7_DIBLA|nr:unnamed protein product [Dibothriocephalus latus]